MRILMATGGSLHSDTAIWLGSEVARHVQAIPTVLTVIESENQRELAEDVLERAKATVSRSVSDVETKIRIGKAEDEIVAETVEGDYDLVIVGERQIHGLRTRMFGSVAKYVLRHAPCSVLLAKGKIESIQRILLCDSGVGASAALTNFINSPLLALATENVNVTVLHVMSQITAAPGVEDTELRADVDQLISTHGREGLLLERDILLLNERGIHPNAKVRHGLIVDEILAEAQSGDYDLVVTGVRNGEGWQRFLLDDISQQVATKIDRPLLIIRS